MDCRPDRNALRRLSCRAARDLFSDADGSHIFDWNFNLEFKFLALAGVHDRDLPVLLALRLGLEFLAQLLLDFCRIIRMFCGCLPLGGRPTPSLSSAQKRCYRFQWALSCREPNALNLASTKCLQSLQRECEVRSAFCGNHSMDFVDDHRVDRAQRLARI